MNFLWQQRTREGPETPEATQQLTQDPLTMAYDDEELDILLENNPMGIWPVTMTRPLSNGVRHASYVHIVTSCLKS